MAQAYEVPAFAYDNPMRKPRLVKVIVNIGVGEAGDRLEKAERVLQMITKKKPSRTVSRQTNREWGIREGMPIGVRVTLRGEDAVAFVKQALDIREFRIPYYSFDEYGNFNFGIADHTDLPGQKYDPEIGIFGLDVAVVIERPGGRVKNRRLLTRKVPKAHRLTREEGMAFMKETFNVEVI